MDKRVGKKIAFLANQSRAFINANVKEINLTYGESNIIVELNHNEGISQDELTNLLNIDKSATTRIIKGMIQKKLIYKKRNVDDKRSNSLYLSDEAKSKLDYILGVYSRSNQRLLEGFNEQDVIKAIEILDKMCSNVSCRGINNE